VVKVMTIDAEPVGRGDVDLSLGGLSGAYVFAITVLPLIGFFLNWNLLNSVTLAATRNLFS
jgi:hypothetical protein